MLVIGRGESIDLPTTNGFGRLWPCIRRLYFSLLSSLGGFGFRSTGLYFHYQPQVRSAHQTVKHGSTSSRPVTGIYIAQPKFFILSSSFKFDPDAFGHKKGEIGKRCVPLMNVRNRPSAASYKPQATCRLRSGACRQVYSLPAACNS